VHYIYKITNIVNNKVYIGQTINPNARWRAHQSYALKKPIQYIHRAMAKHKFVNFIFELILTCKTQDDANEAEDVIIIQYNSRNKKYGYNLNAGGINGISSEETKQKQREATIKQIKEMGHPAKGTRRSEEQRAYLSYAQKNRNNNYTSEIRQRMSDAHIGIKDSEQTKKKKSDSAKLGWLKRRKITNNNGYYREKNKEKIVAKKKEYYENNKAEILKRRKVYYENNKIKSLQQQKGYRKNNKDKIRDINIKYVAKNKEIILLKQQEYYKNNKAILLDKKKIRCVFKYKNDISYKLRQLISCSINQQLKKSSISKSCKSISSILKYSINDFKAHIESLFEPWMNWNNHGQYRANEWDNNNNKTWVWQIDHITPQSCFKIKSINCEELQKCWALNNLRPYSAKQNNIDRNRIG